MATFVCGRKFQTARSVDIEDADFKKNVFNDIKEMGFVAAAFENEPTNLNAMQRAFPRAKMIFLDTLHSPNAEQLNSDISKLKNFVKY